MAKLLISTQVYENYAWGEDGTLGVGVNAYWKPKGGSDYVVKNFKGGDVEATIAIMSLREKIECDNDAYREHIIDWKIVADDYLTEFERDQLEFDGTITYPAVELEIV
jgi:hypothetical protein